MKIEIVDRAMWIAKAKSALQIIADRRKEEDADYERRWLQGKSFFFFKREGKPPATHWMEADEYPSRYGWWVKKEAQELIKACESEGTGAIFVDAEVLRDIQKFEGMES